MAPRPKRRTISCAFKSADITSVSSLRKISSRESGFVVPAQPVDATQAPNLSAGVSKQGLTWSFV